MGSNADELLATQMRALFGNTFALSIGHTLLAAALAYSFWPLLEHHLLLSWYTAVLVSVGYRISLNFFYQHSVGQAVRFWRVWYLVGSVLTGCVWGYIGIFELPSQVYYFTLVVICSIGAATIASSSVYFPAFLFFFIPLVAPTIIDLWIMRGQEIRFLPIVSVIYFVVMIMLARAQNRSAINNINLRFENVELVQQLMQQKDQLIESQQALIEARNKAEKANLAKSRFLAAASHDLRQPLHALGLFIGTLNFKLTASERTELQDRMQLTYKSMTEMFDALLDLSRMDANALEIHLRPTSISQVLNNVLMEFSEQARAKNIVLRSHLAEVSVLTDPIRLELIVRNLLSNALRYTNQGAVLIGVRKRGEDALIQVWDTGVGIPASDICKIYEEFKQLKNCQPSNQEGLGLGLSIVKRLPTK